MKQIRISWYNSKLLENEKEFDEINPEPAIIGAGVYPKGVTKELQKCIVCGKHTTNWFIDDRKKVTWFLCDKCDSGETE